MRRPARHRIPYAACAALAALAACGQGPGSPSPARVTLDPGVRHQTISGWSATAYAGQDSGSYRAFRRRMLNQAVDYLGINRIRLEVRSGAENRRDYWAEFRAGELDAAAWRAVRYSTVNDNDDPHRIDRDGFQFSELDDTVTRVVMPIKRRVEANGEKLFVNLTYVAFTRQIKGGRGYLHNRPEEYAEFVLATMLHLERKFGWLPDSWEVLLEPDNVPQWSGRLLGESIVAAARRLERRGLAVPFVAPSTTSMSAAVTWFDQLAAVPGALDHLGMISYHRYRGATDAALRELAERARRHGLQTGMLEHIPSGFAALYQDLTTGGNSAWQQFTLGGPEANERGGSYFLLQGDPAKPRVVPARRTRYLRHCFRFVRAGAVRIGASSSRPEVEPLAFVNPDGTTVVVVQVHQAGEFTVSGLPAGTYQVRYTVGRHDAAAPAFEDVRLPPRQIGGAGARIKVEVPPSGAGATYGVITIHQQPASPGTVESG